MSRQKVRHFTVHYDKIYSDGEGSINIDSSTERGAKMKFIRRMGKKYSVKRISERK
jgi:hypothetical protein